MVVAATLSGCLLLNGVDELNPDDWHAPSIGRSVIVYGVAVEALWEYPQFGVKFDEYDTERQQGTGNCFRFNHTHAVVSGNPGQVRYFVFSVPPGTYAYSPFQGQLTLSPELRQAGFVAPPGRMVYFGDFIFVRDPLKGARSGTVEVRQNLQAARKAIKGFPRLKGDLLLAEIVPVQPPGMFLCAP
jgi:hypothetical protein